MAIHAVVRLDDMTGTKVGTHLKSVKFYNGASAAAIDNAQLVVLGEKLGREVYKATAPSATSVPEDLYLIASEELFYDQTVTHYLTEWENAADKPARAYKLVPGADDFSATAEAFSGTPADGKFVGFAADSTKLLVQGTKDAKTIGVIKSHETVGYGSGAYTYYMIDVVAHA